MSRSDIVRRLRKRKIGVLMGGWSSEREISLLSGQRVLNSLKNQGFQAAAVDINRNFVTQIRDAKIDLAFIILHGRPGEDGSIQGYLDMLGVPYTGSGVTASAVCMDKVFTKELFRRWDIPTPDDVVIGADDPVASALAEAEKRFGYPMIAKPRAEGSSVGIELLEGRRGANERCERVRRGFGDILLEQFIPGMVATVGILVNEALPILELVPKRQKFYDYEAKYTRGETDFVLPARLDAKVEAQIKEMALRAFRRVGCKGFARIDLLVKAAKHPYFLEINTLPGLTDVSDLPAEAEAAGISYDELIFRILADALI
ncbi:MAG: D-alanine--D-alanine ligase [bacterium]